MDHIGSVFLLVYALPIVVVAGVAGLHVYLVRRPDRRKLLNDEKGAHQ